MNTITIIFALLALPLISPADGFTARQLYTENETFCAITTTGGAKCWGWNTGSGTYAYSTVPLDVVGLTSGVKDLSLNGLTTCALTTLGAVKCWGLDSNGQLGNGAPYENSPVPVDVLGLSSGVVSIGKHYGAGFCALTSDGAVKCWGINCGATDSTPPTTFEGLESGVKTMVVGDSNICAVMENGEVKCTSWFTSKCVPVTVPGFTNYRAYVPVLMAE